MEWMTPILTDLLQGYWWLVLSTVTGTVVIVSGLAASVFHWVEDIIPTESHRLYGAARPAGNGEVRTVVATSAAVRSAHGAPRTGGRSQGP